VRNRKIGSFCAGGCEFSFGNHVNSRSGTKTNSSPVAIGRFFPRVKRPQCKFDHSLSKFKKQTTYSATLPYTVTMCCLVKHKKTSHLKSASFHTDIHPQTASGHTLQQHRTPAYTTTCVRKQKVKCRMCTEGTIGNKGQPI
jgi:hypothetical protein